MPRATPTRPINSNLGPRQCLMPTFDTWPTSIRSSPHQPCLMDSRSMTWRLHTRHSMQQHLRSGSAAGTPTRSTGFHCLARRLLFNARAGRFGEIGLPFLPKKSRGSVNPSRNLVRVDQVKILLPSTWSRLGSKTFQLRLDLPPAPTHMAPWVINPLLDHRRRP